MEQQMENNKHICHICGGGSRSPICSATHPQDEVEYELHILKSAVYILLARLQETYGNEIWTDHPPKDLYKAIRDVAAMVPVDFIPTEFDKNKIHERAARLNEQLKQMNEEEKRELGKEVARLLNELK